MVHRVEQNVKVGGHMIIIRSSELENNVRQIIKELATQPGYITIDIILRRLNNPYVQRKHVARILASIIDNNRRKN